MIPKKLVSTRWLRFLLEFLSITLALTALLLLTSYITIYYAHHRALELLTEVRELEPGITSVEDVKKLVVRYGGEEFDAHSYYGYVGSDKKYTSPDPCLGEEQSYAIFGSPPSIVMRAVHAFPLLQKIGLHLWSVSLNIHHKDGKVTCYSQYVGFTRPDEQEVEAIASLTLRNPQSLIEQKPYEAQSFVSRSYYHHTRVDVLPEATAEQKSRAFQMDLSCTVSLRGCYLPCQIIPFGWLDSLRDRQVHGWDLPEGAGDPRCPRQ